MEPLTFLTGSAALAGCALSYSPDRLRLGEIDHIVPVCEGGSNMPENLRLLCAPCHKSETASLAKRRAKTASLAKKRTAPKRAQPHPHECNP